MDQILDNTLISLGSNRGSARHPPLLLARLDLLQKLDIIVVAATLVSSHFDILPCEYMIEYRGSDRTYLPLLMKVT